MAATTTHLMTVEEFRQLPEDDAPVYYELRHGEVVAVPRPKLKHHVIQDRLCDYFKALAPPGSFVGYELAFRALPEHEFRVADLAWVSPERWATADMEDNIRGAPDLVIEILSPSNSAAEMRERKELCLNNGAKEFWVVDPVRRLVKVSTPSGDTRTFSSGQEIPLPLFGEGKLAVDDIWGWKAPTS
jgi:Uma2 family endonuclease